MRYFVISSAILIVLLIGCEIERSERGATGAVYVTLVDSAQAPLRGRISVDGAETSQFTPSVVANLSVGTHRIEALVPGYLRAVSTVEVLFHDTVSVGLATTVAPPAVIELVDAPDSTVLLLNNTPFGTTPPRLFPSVGIGDYVVSMYLAGHATNLPAQWNISLALGDTVRIPVGLTPVSAGNQAGSLAPTFSLPVDWDSSIYRLQDYRGRVLLVTFFFVNCAPCIAEFPSIQAVYDDPALAGRIEFFGIDPNDSFYDFSLFRTVFHPELGLEFPLLYGQGAGVQQAFGVIQFPTNFIIDQTGVIRYRLAGVTETMLRDAINTLLTTGE